MPCCYTGGGETTDDEALAALALWFATKDARFRKDLLEDPARGTNTLSVFNQGDFPTGILAHDGNRPFHPGGWTYGLPEHLRLRPLRPVQADYEQAGPAAAYGIERGGGRFPQARTCSPRMKRLSNRELQRQRPPFRRTSTPTHPTRRVHQRGLGIQPLQHGTGAGAVLLLGSDRDPDSITTSAWTT